MSARTVLMVGSARPTGTSTSESLGRYLLDRLQDRQARVLHVNRLRSDASCESLLRDVDLAGLVVLAAPVYVDSLPYLVTRAFEKIARHRAVAAARHTTRLVAIINCGFPEAFHTTTALDICRVFAREARLEWAGGLGLGGGEAIAGKPLHEAGLLVRNVRRALDLTADALVAGHDVPDEAVALMARPMVPSRLYTLLASMRWRREARANGARRRLAARPFQRPTGSPRRSDPRLVSMPPA